MPKSGYKRASRVADQIRIEVADIIMRKTKDPRLSSVTVTDVDLTADLRQAHVYFTSFSAESKEAILEVQSGLTSASGFIRSELGRRVHLRYTPELSFHHDQSGPKGDRILTLLEGLEGAAANRAQDESASSETSGHEQ
jgi:ribosome-binding factor A